MQFSVFVGNVTVISYLLLLIFIIITFLRKRKREIFDIQFYILLISIFLLLPVMGLENLLFWDLNYKIFDLSYSINIMRLTFALGIIGYLIYNIHLLTIQDLPTFPVSILSIFAGFAIGAMLTSSQLNVENITSPIYYDPITGGVYFIVSLMVFNLIGLIGFMVNMWQSKKVQFNQKFASRLDLIGIINFFISPLIIFSLRILSITIFPFNFIFLSPTIAFILHLLSKIKNPEKSGYPTLMEVIALNLIDLDTTTVIGGYSKVGQLEESKLNGMSFIAVDATINQMISTITDEKHTDHEGQYGDLIFIIYGKYLLTATLVGGGKKLGTLLLKRFLKEFNKQIKEGIDIDFKKLLNKYLYLYCHKTFEIDESKIYFHR